MKEYSLVICGMIVRKYEISDKIFVKKLVSWFSDNFCDIDFRLLKWKDSKKAFI
jgi:hypothetical protein